MPQTLTILRIFVASPSDLNEERRILEDVVRELNLSWSHQIGISLELVKWETHTIPGVGTDPQSVIDNQIADYDILLAMFWTRIGTPTLRHKSGTIEEFENAYHRWHDNPSSVRLMVYFKTSRIAPDQIDTDQLRSLQEFRNSLGERGVLYFTFDADEEFAQLLRIHLTKQVQDFVTASPNNISSQSLQATFRKDKILHQPDSSPNTSENDDGFLDLVEISVTESARATEVMRHLGKALELLNNKTTETTTEMNSINGDDNAKVAAYKRLSNQQADSMNDFTVSMKSELSILEDALFKALDAYGKTISLLPDFGRSPKNHLQLKQALEAANVLRSSIAPFNNSMEHLRLIISELPRITTQFNRAKRDLLILLDSILSINTRALNLISEIETTGSSILSSWESVGNGIQ